MKQLMTALCAALMVACSLFSLPALADGLTAPSAYTDVVYHDAVSLTAARAAAVDRTDPGGTSTDRLHTASADYMGTSYDPATGLVATLSPGGAATGIACMADNGCPGDRYQRS